VPVCRVAVTPADERRSEVGELKCGRECLVVGLFRRTAVPEKLVARMNRSNTLCSTLRENRAVLALKVPAALRGYGLPSLCPELRSK
jgi:hypothetical protein